MGVLRFQVYTESTGEARWTLTADDEQVVASSVDSFGTSGTAERSAEDFKDQADTCDYDVWDNDGLWYWDANASNGRPIVNGATTGFASEYQATLAYRHVRDHAGSADGPVNASAVPRVSRAAD